MAKPSFFKLSSQDGHYSLERFWAQTGITDAGVTARFFQLFGGRSELGGASESAQAVTGASDRAPLVRAPELAAISIPSAGLDSRIPIAWETFASAASGETPRADAEGTDEAARVANVQFTAVPVLATSLKTVEAEKNPGNITVVFDENLVPIGLYDTTTKKLMEGGPGNYPELGQGPDDLLELSGDFSQGFVLGQVIRGLDTIVLRGGNDYNFTATDDLIDRGGTLTISAMPLKAGDHFLFDGSGETDGRFVFLGSGYADAFIGGAGDDRIQGHGGPDILAGGRGSDVFAYTFAYESTGAGYDTIGDFDAALDRIDLRHTVSGFMDAIEGGTLSQGSFDADLGAALAGLGANQAAWFAPDAGDLAGTIFLVVDGNGTAGYQQGEDYVLAIGGKPLADLTGHTDIFI